MKGTRWGADSNPSKDRSTWRRFGNLWSIKALSICSNCHRDRSPNGFRDLTKSIKLFPSCNLWILLPNKDRRDPILTRSLKARPLSKPFQERRCLTGHRNWIWRGAHLSHRKYFWSMTNKSIQSRSKRLRSIKGASQGLCRRPKATIQWTQETVRKVLKGTPGWPHQAKGRCQDRSRFLRYLVVYFQRPNRAVHFHPQVWPRVRKSYTITTYRALR
jgi:hypothetical protein